MSIDFDTKAEFVRLVSERDQIRLQRDEARKERDKYKTAWREAEKARHTTQQQRDAAEAERDEARIRLEDSLEAHRAACKQLNAFRRERDEIRLQREDARQEVERLRAETHRIAAERDEARTERDIAKGFHDVAVQQRNSAWRECNVLRTQAAAQRQAKLDVRERLKAALQDRDRVRAQRDAAEAQRDALREAIGTDDDVEAYLRALPWTPEDADRDRTLVAGNIRTFHAWIQDRAGIGDGS